MIACSSLLYHHDIGLPFRVHDGENQVGYSGVSFKNETNYIAGSNVILVWNCLVAFVVSSPRSCTSQTT